jgi:flagellar FliL protein
MEKHAFAIRSEMLDVMRKIDETRLAEPNFRGDLAEQLKIAVNSVLEKYEDFGGVEEVMFTEFVVQ